MSFWPEDQMVLARKLWAEDRTASEIGKVLGVSRNAVLGMAHRNRHLFPQRAEPPKGGNQKRSFSAAHSTFVMRRRSDKIAAETRPERPDPDFKPDRPIAFVDLGRGQCHWPLWPSSDNPGPAGLCCGNPIDAPPSVYCRHHRLVALERRAA